MAQNRTHPLVALALELLMRNPDMPAREILSRARAEHAMAGFDFDAPDPQRPDKPHPAYGDELHPPSPFAELLRRAYAPTLDPREALLLALLEREEEPGPELSARIDTMVDRWQLEVVEKFMDDLGGV